MHKTSRLLTALAVTLLTITLLATPVLAGDIGADVEGGNNNGTDTILADSSKINDDDGAWEVSFYCQDQFRGSFLIGDTTVMMAASQNNPLALQQTPWHFSGGTRLSDGASTATSLITKPVPRYGATSEVRNWGSNPDIMEDIILTNVVKASDLGRGNMSASEAQEIVQLIRDASTATPEQIKEKMDSGEWFPFFVTMHPVMLTFQTGSYKNCL